MSQPTLFTIPGSHPGFAVAMMLRRKGIEYQRVDLLPVLSKAALRALRFPGITVPALKIGGRRLQGSVEIARALDELVPEPPLLPSDPALREAVLEAESWGESELQHPMRQIIWWLLKHNRAPMESYLGDAKIGLPKGLAVKTAAPLVAGSVHFNKANDENVRAAIAALPAQLDRADGYVKSGVIGNEEPNAADFQIVTSIRLAMTMDDLLPAIEGRPIHDVALRVMPDYPGHMPPGLPAQWLEPLGAISHA
jgi:glutathione S-transferase